MNILPFSPTSERRGEVLAGQRGVSAVVADERARQHKSSCIAWTAVAYGFTTLGVIAVASGLPLGMVGLICAAGYCAWQARTEMHGMEDAIHDLGRWQGIREGRREICAQMDRIEERAVR